MFYTPTYKTAYTDAFLKMNPQVQNM